MKKIIFYHPQPIVENPTKGSELRPKKMKEAFESIGYEVEAVVGNSSQRKESINRIKEDIQNGHSYEFLYAESTNLPIPLTGPNHIPTNPLLDYSFFRFLNKESIPIGFFCRDLYWRVEELKRISPYHKYLIKQLFHWLEWFGLKKTVDHLFLPTEKMSKYLPQKWPEGRLSALYPGCDLKNSVEIKSNYSLNQYDRNNELVLFYVGGIKPPYYDLSPLIEVVTQIERVLLIICCKPTDWSENFSYYRKYDLSKIKIVHADSNQIYKYYKQSDILFDIRKPVGYLKNTIPIKLIEAIGYEVPSLVLKGTESAKFVKREGTGWVVNTLTEAKTLLQNLKINHEKLRNKTEKLREIRPKHTWEARARQASDVLEALNN